MMKEFKLTSLDALAKHILTQSEKGAREAIKALPEGEWSYEMPLDGYERELVLKSRLDHPERQDHGRFLRHLARLALRHQQPPHLYPCLCGVRPQGGDRTPCAEQHRLALLLRSRHRARHHRGPDPALARHRAPRDRPDAGGQRLRLPRPGAARHGAGGKCGADLDPVALFRPRTGCRRSRRRRRRPSPSSTWGWAASAAGPARTGSPPPPSPRASAPSPSRSPKRSARFISGASITWPTSGGAGQWRGGVSQIIEIANREDAPFAISAATFDRIIHPAQGREGGAAGLHGLRRARGSGAKLPDKGIHIIETGDSLVLELPGGGGFGKPDKRDRAALEADIAGGAGDARGGAAGLRL